MYLDKFRRKKYFIHIYKKYCLVNLRKKCKRNQHEYIRNALLVNEVSEWGQWMKTEVHYLINCTFYQHELGTFAINE